MQVITNPGYMKDNAFIKIETMHAQDAGAAGEIIPPITGRVIEGLRELTNHPSCYGGPERIF